MNNFILSKSILIYVLVSIQPLPSSASQSLHMMRGALAEKDGRYAEAITEYEKALSEDPDNMELYNSIAHLYRYKLKNNEKAIEVYLKGLKLSPRDFSLNRGLMYAYFDEGKIDDGIVQYRTLSNIRGRKDPYSFPRETLKKILQGMGNQAKVTFCRDYLAVNPTDMTLRETLADIYMNMKDYEHAKIEYKAMIEYGNKTGFIYFSLGVCYYYLGLYQDSLTSFTAAQDLGSYVPEKYFEMIHEKLGDNVENGDVVK